MAKGIHFWCVAAAAMVAVVTMAAQPKEKGEEQGFVRLFEKDGVPDG